jgi:HEAT repeat protein
VLVSDAAVEDLAGMGEVAGDALLGLLADPRLQVRAGAIRALGLLRDPRAAAPLAAALSVPGHGAADDFAQRHFRILSLQALGRIGDAAGAEVLRRFVDGGDAFERTHAGISLFLLGEDPGYDVVQECLADSAVALRSLAADGLGESRDPRARRWLLELTGDSSWVVREAACRSLGRWPPDEGVRGALERAGGDPSWFVRQTAAAALRGTVSAELEKGES